jgi:DNA-binding HxlR family transcriptional regulator
LDPHESCKAQVATLARIGDKWTVLVVGALSKGPIRYNEIRRRVEGISQRMLRLTLKGRASSAMEWCTRRTIASRRDARCGPYNSPSRPLSRH